ncbi:glycosyltransferase [Spirilliplanes yamanashiensis]|uniref:Glycosyl transferase family 1 n=1 Tax=Spirilliplanes yamanashiensis TaxID=42233 RepID=A0A8J3YFJ2_9ACTN|nr:glycosyltransferase [Spirilliplanes yamanashiensis]MDP9818220.1 trehalose synthase [Spirilliplanes yamanashiensis]GIJ06752.1 glycosyl transferase family 1 [Spirilliplanes yamanashiensis]
MSLLRTVPAERRPIAALESVVGPERYTRLLAAAHALRPRLAGRTIWNVNSTAVGGGVAEMLQTLVGYGQDLGIVIRWVVISGDPAFFALTKGLHNALHGFAGSGPPAGPAEAAHYEQVLADNAAELVDLVRPGDMVLLHDPQTAGLAPWLRRAGAHVVWRCHIGADEHSAVTLAGWEFLRPYLTGLEGYVFSRRRYVPPWLPAAAVEVIPPSIDPFSAKNEDMSDGTVQAVLRRIGFLDGAVAPPPFVRRDGHRGEVVRRAAVVADRLPGPDEPMLLQVSRWDRLKDMGGVLHGFAAHVAPEADGYLALVGPSVATVADDPEGAAVYAECVRQWQDLPAAVRARVMLVTLPLDDVDENAAMVNALQRHAAVVAQKSLAEGFGLTVAEAMWKGRPVVGSAVGGIPDQIAAGTGVLVGDPADLAAFGAAVRDLLRDPAAREAMGAAAHEHIRAEFVGDQHLMRYARLFTRVGGWSG